MYCPLNLLCKALSKWKNPTLIARANISSLHCNMNNVFAAHIVHIAFNHIDEPDITMLNNIADNFKQLNVGINKSWFMQSCY